MDQNLQKIVLPNKEDLRSRYETYRPIFSSVLFGIEQKLKRTLKLPSMPTFKTRVKDFSSYYSKLLRVRPPSLGSSELPVLTDLLGIRVICAFLEDIAVVEKQIKDSFDIVEIERKGADRTFREFGYESIHILVIIPEEILYDGTEEFSGDLGILPDGLVCEIQLRTILQDAWAEVEHELVYKSEFSPFDLPLRRKLASMNASLSLADIIFQEIRDYQNKLNNELEFRRNSFYEKADTLFHNRLAELLPESDTGSVPEPIAPVSPYVHGTIDDMILEAIHAHNTGSLDRAVHIYSAIIESKPEPNNIVLSVIYKHRGMAYFAQNKYQEALQDFISSTVNDPRNFRSFYYTGIVYSVITEHEKAIESFSKSLEINNFQSHVYYRKALSYYHLADYAAAVAQLDKALQLGLNDEDCQKLHNVLITKLGMSM